MKSKKLSKTKSSVTGQKKVSNDYIEATNVHPEACDDADIMQDIQAEEDHALGLIGNIDPPEVEDYYGDDDDDIEGYF